MKKTTLGLTAAVLALSINIAQASDALVNKEQAVKFELVKGDMLRIGSRPRPIKH